MIVFPMRGRTCFVAAVVSCSLVSLAGFGQAAPAQKANPSTASTSNLPAIGAALASFTLRDDFKRDWRNELVIFPVDAKVSTKRAASIVGPDGTARPAQWVKRTEGNAVAFMADVAPDSEATFKLVASAAPGKSDVQVEEAARTIRLTNGVAGIDIRTTLGEGEAPIAAVRLLSGQWVGGSDRSTAPALASFKAEVVERGPVFAEVLCQASFAGGGNWRMRFRLISGEPAIIVSETCNLGAGSSWRLRLDPNFAPSGAFHRVGSSRRISTFSFERKKGSIYSVEPWARWWDGNCGNWLSVFSEASEDMLTLGALDPSVWVDPEKRRDKVPQSYPGIGVSIDGKVVAAGFDLTGGVRRWLIAAQDKSPSLNLLQDKELRVSPPPQQLVIKHGDFPLDRVKDWVLQWDDKVDHPRTMVTKKDLPMLRAAYRADPVQLQRFRSKLTQYTAVAAYPIYIGTGDEKIGAGMAAAALNWSQAQVDNFMNQTTNKSSMGSFPQLQWDLPLLVTVVDAVWDTGFAPEQKRRIMAQMALLGYAVNSPNCWSPERGFSANPNMTTMVAGFQAGIGILVGDHPMSKQWTENGLAELKKQVENWTDANGGLLEAPHYGGGSLETWIANFAAARSSDGGALLFQDRIKKASEFLARISTPPDPRVSNMRHLPRIGNTWLNEPYRGFGALAALWKEKDPQFAAEMQWMYQQHASQPMAILGLFTDPTIEPKKPNYESALFPQTGVSMRNGVDDRETQLYLIAGWNHEHYDWDSGSITIWGKGRPVADDFAYNGRDPASWHSMVESPGQARVMEVQKFTPSKYFDYVRGVSGVWHRQIAFIKDSDMMAPNYFVVRDSMRQSTAGTWRMWFDGKTNIVDANPNAADVQSQAVQVIGAFDVDTDLTLVSSGGLKLTTEEKTTRTTGWGADLKMAQKLPTTLNAVIAPMGAGQDILTLIFPRLKTQKTPRVTALAQGRGFKVEHAAGTDYILLNDEVFSYNEGGVSFEGTSGLVRLRGEQTAVALGEGGKLTARGQSTGGEIPDAVRKLSTP